MARLCSRWCQHRGRRDQRRDDRRGSRRSRARAREEIDARGLHVFPGASTSTFTSTSRGGAIGKAGHRARPPAPSVARRPWPRCLSTPIRRPSMVRPSTPSMKRPRPAPLSISPFGGADTGQSRPHGRACGTRRDRIQGVHVELRHRRFPRGRRRYAVRGDATRGGAGSPGSRARRERRAHHSLAAKAITAAGSPLATISPRDRLSLRSRPSSRAVLFAEETGCAFMSSMSALVVASPNRGGSRPWGRCDGRDLPALSRFRRGRPGAAGRSCQVRSAAAAAVRGRALWQALDRGDIQIVASDHSPAPAG